MSPTTPVRLWNLFVRQPHNIEASGIFAPTSTSDFSYVYTGSGTQRRAA